MEFSFHDDTTASEGELAQVKAILHLAGDMVAIPLATPDKELRSNMLFNFIMAATEFKQHVSELMDELLFIRSAITELEGNLESQTLFGVESLKDSLLSLLSEEEQAEALEMFSAFDPKNLTSSDDDDDGANDEEVSDEGGLL
jgi:hypothetical protein